MTVAVTGIGLRSALGDLSYSWQALRQGQSGIRFAQPFAAFPPLPLGLIHAQPSTLADLVPAIALEALADAGLDSREESWGVVVGSSRACQGQWEQWVQHPERLGAQWLSSLPHQAALLASQVLPQVAVIQSPMAACATGLWAIAQGCELIRSGRCQQVLVGAIEAPVTPLTLAGFQQMGALAPTGCYPFSEEREGLVLGEGGVLFVLESLAQAQTRQVPIYG
ncbi:MAG: beta-ketoacyl synthase N-terminal-like domain-containing protein, partial [Microcystaceae cyanobacterium]